jgi:hypothetical protein
VIAVRLLTVIPGFFLGTLMGAFLFGVIPSIVLAVLFGADPGMALVRSGGWLGAISGTIVAVGWAVTWEKK